jgi:hypothetical protein
VSHGDAVKKEVIATDPMDRVAHTPKIVRKEMNYLNQDEVVALPNIKCEWKPLWTLLIGTGLEPVNPWDFNGKISIKLHKHQKWLEL